MKYLITLTLLICLNYCTAQHKQDYNWLLGREASIADDDKGYIFDFNSNPVDIRRRDNGIGLGGNDASISDKEGNLLFYSNGCAVLNRYGEIMPNGHDIVDTVWMNKWNDDCNLGYVGGQDILILPNPDGSDTYYLINKPEVFNGFNVDGSFPIWYNIIDINKDNGRGDLILKNKILLNKENTLKGFLTSIRHENKTDWWIIQPLRDDSIFTTFLLTKDGFQRYPDQNTHEFFNSWRSSSGGTAKFSPDGTKYALYTFVDQLHIYDFDRSNGVLSNHQKIFVYPNPDQDEVRFCSVEWSPNSRFIYTASSKELHQVDTWEDDIQNDGIRLIAEWDGTKDPFSNTFYLMAQGPDCRIYMCSTSGNNSYHVIRNPDRLGKACNFCQSCLQLPEPANIGTMPNFPRFRVDAAEKCDSTIDLVLGMPVWYEEKLVVYPNPSSGIYTIKSPALLSNYSIDIYDMNGKMIKQLKDLTSNELNIDLTSLPKGQYVVELYDLNSNLNTIYKAKITKH